MTHSKSKNESQRTDPELSPEDFYGSYMQTYLERDIRVLITV